MPEQIGMSKFGARIHLTNSFENELHQAQCEIGESGAIEKIALVIYL